MCRFRLRLDPVKLHGTAMCALRKSSTRPSHWSISAVGQGHRHHVRSFATWNCGRPSPVAQTGARSTWMGICPNRCLQDAGSQWCCAKRNHCPDSIAHPDLFADRVLDNLRAARELSLSKSTGPSSGECLPRALFFDNPDTERSRAFWTKGWIRTRFPNRRCAFPLFRLHGHRPFSSAGGRACA